MKFCTICDNMLYLQLEDENRLKFHCKNCNATTYHNDNAKEEKLRISTKSFEADANSYKNYMTPYIVNDKTLPRANNIKCPNCKPDDNEVIYINYDHANMKYLYNCCHCKHFWKN